MSRPLKYPWVELARTGEFVAWDFPVGRIKPGSHPASKVISAAQRWAANNGHTVRTRRIMIMPPTTLEVEGGTFTEDGQIAAPAPLPEGSGPRPGPVVRVAVQFLIPGGPPEAPIFGHEGPEIIYRCRRCGSEAAGNRCAHCQGCLTCGQQQDVAQ